MRGKCDDFEEAGSDRDPSERMRGKCDDFEEAGSDRDPSEAFKSAVIIQGFGIAENSMENSTKARRKCYILTSLCVLLAIVISVLVVYFTVLSPSYKNSLEAFEVTNASTVGDLVQQRAASTNFSVSQSSKFNTKNTDITTSVITRENGQTTIRGNMFSENVPFLTKEIISSTDLAAHGERGLHGFVDGTTDVWRRHSDVPSTTAMHWKVVLSTANPRQTIQVRLAGGPNEREGRVEVWYNQQWGSVCHDNHWDQNDTTVICRMLGLRSVIALPRPQAASIYGQGTGTVWLDGIQCTGTEMSLQECVHGRWGLSTCSHNKDAGLICVAPLQVRLANSPWINRGRVEIYQMNTWGTLCSTEWDDRDALVFCKMLGFEPLNAQAVTSESFGPGTGRIWLERIRCTGLESSILHCSHGGWGKTTCNHQQDAGLICKVCPPGKTVCGDKRTCIMLEWLCDGEPDCPDRSDETNCKRCKIDEIQCGNRVCIPIGARCNGVTDCSDGSDEAACVRKVATERFLQIRKGQHWYPVCSDGWTPSHSETACVQLGYKRAALTQHTGTTHLSPINVFVSINPHTHSSSFIQTFQTYATCRANAVVTLSCQETECGMRSVNPIQSFIIGGNSAERGIWPWMAYIRAGEELCGGTLKDHQWVITAGHCVYRNRNSPDTVEMRLGSIMGSGYQDNYSITVTVAEIIIHPSYYEANGIAYHDIALLKLTNPVPYNNVVKPACLPSVSEQELSSMLCYITGFGRVTVNGPLQSSLPSTLQQAKVRLLGKAACERAYRHLPSNSICAGYHVGNIGICDGDSGGPLVCLNSNQRWMLMGVSSFSESCAKRGFPAVYTKVSSYVTWIEEKTPIQDQSIDCNFENGVCDYKQFAKTTYKWYRHKGNAGSVYTGPQMDHTYRNSSGYYLFAKASLGNETDQALLISPLFIARQYHCLHFAYFMYGATMSTINIQLNYDQPKADVTNKRLIRSMSTNAGNVWRMADVLLPPGSYFIEFEIIRGAGDLGDIAIDDIYVVPGKCPVT